MSGVPALTSWPSAKAILTIWPSTRLLIVTMLYAWTVPIAFRKTGASVAATVPAVTGTPGADGGGDWASALGATVPVTHGITIASTARVRTAAIAVRFMGASFESADLYGMYIIDKDYVYGLVSLGVAGAAESPGWLRHLAAMP